MASWLRAARRPQDGPGDPFLDWEAGESAEGRAFLENRDAGLLGLFLPLLKASAKVLVVGCGTGRLALKLAQARPDCEVTGLDRSGPALEDALEKARTSGLVGRVWFLEGDACRLGLPERSFDAALCDGLLHHLSEPARFFEGLARVIRPGGLALMREPERPVRPFWSRLFGLRRPAVPKPLQEAWGASAAAAYTLEELQGICERSPLAGAEVRRVPAGSLIIVRRS